MTWNYRAIKDKHGVITMREFFPKFGYTEPIEPYGETKKELRKSLILMLLDLEKYGVVTEEELEEEELNGSSH